MRRRDAEAEALSEEVVCWAGDKELPDAFLTDSSEWKVGTLGDPELWIF